LILELLSVAAVVVGIAGELNVDFKAGRLESNLREANSQLMLVLGREAGSAKSSAEGAAKAACQAEGASEKVRKQAEQLAIELEAEKERHEPRHITPAQAKCMLRALAGMRGRPIAVSKYGSPEARRFAYEVMGALTSPQIGIVISQQQFEYNFPSYSGLLLTGSAPKEYRDAMLKAVVCLEPDRPPQNSPDISDKDDLHLYVFPDFSRRSPSMPDQ
jgi:hypothetical protein